MRVLIATHGYPPTYNGGAERRAERTARGIAALGYDTTVISIESISAPHPELRWEDRIQDGIPVRRLSFDLLGSRAPFDWSYDNPRTGEALGQLIDEHQPAVVHLFSGYLMSASAVRAAATRHVPVVISLTDYWWLCHRINLVRSDGSRCDGPTPAGCARCHAESRRRYRLPAQLWPWGASRFWEAVAGWPALHQPLGMAEQVERSDTLRETLAQVDAFIAPSHYLAEVYGRFGVDRTKIRVWRQGVELQSCRLRAPSEQLRFGYMGQIKHHKGIHLLVDAWSRLQGDRPRRLTLFGSSTGEEAYGRQMRAMIERSKGVSWAGQFAGSEVWNVLADIDVLVVPSRWVENSPNSILEAQAVGVPIVGANLGGVAELVEHERNGLRFAVDDVDDLARQMQRLLDEPDLLHQLRRSPMPFQSADEEVNRISGLYQELARRPAATR